MAWIESHQGLGRHPKLRRLARLLEIHPAQAVGHLHFLWWWALDYAQDGSLEDFDTEDIAAAAEWPGEASELVAALAGAGFIDEDTMQIHDWWDYAGKLIALRESQQRAGRFGNHQRHHVGKGKYEPTCEYCRGGPPPSSGTESGTDDYPTSGTEDPPTSGTDAGPKALVTRYPIGDRPRPPTRVSLGSARTVPNPTRQNLLSKGRSEAPRGLGGSGGDPRAYGPAHRTPRLADVRLTDDQAYLLERLHSIGYRWLTDRSIRKLNRELGRRAVTEAMQRAWGERREARDGFAVLRSIAEELA